MQNPKILVLEDEAITCGHLVRVLRRLGYDIAGVAATGARALETLEQTSPDLLLADIGLEGDLDGIEVAARAREESNVPTVFLTAYGDANTLQRARATGPYGYVIKPFVEQELHASIEIALQQRRLQAEQEQEARVTAQSLIRTQKELSDITARLFQAQERERAEVARDLHDDIGQRLALLQVGFESLWRRLPRQLKEKHKREFEDILRSATELSDSVRTVSHRLHPGILKDLGLVVALQQLAEEFEERYLIRTRFSARSVPDPLNPEISVAVYRIAQEALRNIGKHASPASVNIALVGNSGNIELSIRDNGRGFEPLKLKQQGLGLISMVERASALGGKVTIDAKPGEGARIHACIPLTASAEQAGVPVRLPG